MKECAGRGGFSENTHKKTTSVTFKFHYQEINAWICIEGANSTVSLTVSHIIKNAKLG